MQTAEVVYLGIGSSKGDRPGNLRRATEMIESLIGKIIRSSEVYETSPWGFESLENFLNMVLIAETFLAPDELLDKIHSIESALGRKRTGNRYSHRVIDIDILFYGNRVIKTDALTVPHPLLHKRKFVLVPLCSIAPEMVHPVKGKTIRALLDECTDEGMVVLFNQNA
ncbi:MAG TPA: 2-amino-4-hydroxy-6-hydroxymethyldihydropteridine diphosphokinase [Bacteroidales bacterium]|nr:2-amino-4-hydroxy-6-hydroxymethyldihydropteridine diphosphokinase [Bacteroidales bacterium]HQK70720.1 2-amino-4-hydroxy-6-hydroxymethyldihydropteridine diphosphokinase [Bacteroidales bacterium]